MKKNIIYFVLLTALIQFVCQLMYRILDDHAATISFLSQYVINLPVSIFIGVIDFFIIDIVYKKMKRQDNGIRIFIDLLLSSLFVLFLAFCINVLFSPLEIYDYLSKLTLPLIVWNTIVVLLIEIFFYNQKQLEAESHLAVIQKEKLQYQYETLKAQINPHFLFNSLNVLSALTYKDAEKANLFTKKLSGVYRYLLLTNKEPIVSVREELAFLDLYLYLEKTRFGNAFSVVISMNNESLNNRRIIPVSLQLLVENALKHNMATEKQPLAIHLEIKEEGIWVKNNLQLHESTEKGGVGLANLKKQYELFGKEIKVTQTISQFIVWLPYL